MITELVPVVDEFIFTNAPSAPETRRWDPGEAADFAASMGKKAHAIAEIGDAMDEATHSAKTVLVTGSFHTVGDVMSRLQVSPFAA